MSTLDRLFLSLDKMYQSHYVRDSKYWKRRAVFKNRKSVIQLVGILDNHYPKNDSGRS